MKMKIFGRLLLLTLLGCVRFQCAGGLPEHLRLSSILVEMDGFTYIGDLEYMNDLELPRWMEPHNPRYVVDNYVFIRTRYGEHFKCALDKTRRPSVAGPRPVSADIRLHVDVFYTAVGFKLYPMPTVYHEEAQPHFPRANRIYITKIGGPVYFAPLKEYTPVPRVAISHGR